MSKNGTSTSKKAVSFDYLKGREAVKIYLDSSNLEEMLSGLWVLSTSVGALVVSVPLLLRTQQVETPMRHKVFYCFTEKNTDRTLDTNNLPC